MNMLNGLNGNQRRFIDALAKAVVSPIRGPAGPAPIQAPQAVIDQEAARFFYKHPLPGYWTPAGLVATTLHKVDVSRVNGETVAYYDLRYFDSTVNRHVFVRYLYAIRNGDRKEIKKFEAKYS